MAKINEPTVNTTEELESVLRDVTLNNSVLDFKWQFEYKAVEVLFCGGDTQGETKDGWLLWASFERPDTLTGEIGRGRGRDEIVWEGTSLSGVVKTCWLLLELLIKHEAMESFMFCGKRIFNPHHTVFELSSIQRKHEEKL